MLEVMYDIGVGTLDAQMIFSQVDSLNSYEKLKQEKYFHS